MSVRITARYIPTDGDAQQYSDLVAECDKDMTFLEICQLTRAVAQAMADAGDEGQSEETKH